MKVYSANDILDEEKLPPEIKWEQQFVYSASRFGRSVLLELTPEKGVWDAEPWVDYSLPEKIAQAFMEEAGIKELHELTGLEIRMGVIGDGVQGIKIWRS